jgi:hypothetical protein
VRVGWVIIRFSYPHSETLNHFLFEWKSCISFTGYPYISSPHSLLPYNPSLFNSSPPPSLSPSHKIRTICKKTKWTVTKTMMWHFVWLGRNCRHKSKMRIRVTVGESNIFIHLHVLYVTDQMESVDFGCTLCSKETEMNICVKMDEAWDDWLVKVLLHG